jgi:nucleotide-binding universal stress UspA family protein
LIKLQEVFMATAHQAKTLTHLQIAKIAVLTDLSENAANSLRFAAAIARGHEASIVLAHAYMPSSCAYAAPEAEMVLQSLDAERQRLKTRLLDEARVPFLRGIRCAVLLIEGTPKDLLEKLKDADLIVVGTSGERGLGKATLGSTAEAIFRSSSVPVLTVGPHCNCRGAEETALNTVLYATDFSAGAAIALPYALSIAEEQGAQLVLLHVASDKNVPFSFDRSMASAEPLEALHRLVPNSAGLKSQPMCIVGFGMPNAVIIGKARNLQAGVIVMGARGAGRFSSVVSHFGGGTAYEVAANAECPVLTVPTA